MRDTFLWISPVINNRYFLNAANGAMWRARLFCEIFSLNVGECVLLERDSGIAALLGAVVHEAVFTNVQITSAGAASPIVWFTPSEVFLEPIKPAVAVLTIGLDLAVDAFLATAQRLH